MAAKKRAAKKAAGQPAAKRQRKQDDPVWCTESKNSPLAKEDLVVCRDQSCFETSLTVTSRHGTPTPKPTNIGRKKIGWKRDSGYLTTLLTMKMATQYR